MLNTIDVDIKETQSADNNVQEKFINEKNYKILEQIHICLLNIFLIFN